MALLFVGSEAGFYGAIATSRQGHLRVRATDDGHGLADASGFGVAKFVELLEGGSDKDECGERE